MATYNLHLTPNRSCCCSKHQIASFWNLTSSILLNFSSSRNWNQSVLKDWWQWYYNYKGNHQNFLQSFTSLKLPWHSTFKGVKSSLQLLKYIFISFYTSENRKPRYEKTCFKTKCTKSVSWKMYSCILTVQDEIWKRKDTMLEPADASVLKEREINLSDLSCSEKA